MAETKKKYINIGTESLDSLNPFIVDPAGDAGHQYTEELRKKHLRQRPQKPVSYNDVRYSEPVEVTILPRDTFTKAPAKTGASGTGRGTSTSAPRGTAGRGPTVSSGGSEGIPAWQGTGQRTGTTRQSGSAFSDKNIKSTFEKIGEAAEEIKGAVSSLGNIYSMFERNRILNEMEKAQGLNDENSVKIEGRRIKTALPLIINNRLETLIKQRDELREKTGKENIYLNMLIKQIQAEEEAMRVEAETGVPTSPTPTPTATPTPTPTPTPSASRIPTPQGGPNVPPRTNFEGESFGSVPRRPPSSTAQPTATPQTNFEGESFGRVPKRPPASTAEPTPAPRTNFEGESFGRIPKRPPSSAGYGAGSFGQGRTGGTGGGGYGTGTERETAQGPQGAAGTPNSEGQGKRKSWSEFFFPKKSPAPTMTPSPTMTPEPTAKPKETLKPTPMPTPAPEPSPSPSPEASREKTFEEIMKEHWDKEDADREKERKSKHKWTLFSAGLSAAGILYGIYAGRQRQRELKEHLAKMEEKEEEFLKELHGAADGSEEKAAAQKKLDDLRSNEMSKIRAELLREAVKSIKSDNDDRKNKDRNVGYFMRQFGKSLRGGRANDHYHAIQESTPSYNLRKFMQGLNAR